jgi:hypothetical protein
MGASRPTQTSRKVTSQSQITGFPAALLHFPAGALFYPRQARQCSGSCRCLGRLLKATSCARM